jgi:signal transduction histidine kinase
MKLSERIALPVSALLIVAILLVSGSLLVYARKTILALSKEQVEEKQRTLSTSFSEMANYYAASGDSDAVHASLVDYCFSRFADRTSVLLKDGEPVYSSVTVNPAALVPEDSEAYASGTAVACAAQGRNLFIAGSAAHIGSRTYSVYVIEDVTEVHARIRRMAWIFAGVSAAVAAAGAVLVLAVAKESTRPIGKLAKTAREIADGAYEKRADVHRKDEIGLLAGDFNRMADAVETKISELEERNERQRLFIGGVTHEFKTPLTGLLLHTGLLRRAALSDDERDRSLRHIETQTAWLERLVQNLLKLTTSGEEIELQRTSVPELLEEVEDGVAPKLGERGATLAVACETDELTLNAELFKSLLINLIVNAANAYDADAKEKPILLSVAGKTFSVADRGRGIPKEAQDRIFEPFFRVDKSRSKKQGGSGFGLALVKAIADAHNASITVDSEPGKGTTVSVTLP